MLEMSLTLVFDSITQVQPILKERLFCICKLKETQV